MRVGDRPTSPHLERAPRGLWQQERREQCRRRSRRVGEDWTEKVSIDIFDISIATREDVLLSIRQR